MKRRQQYRHSIDFDSGTWHEMHAAAIRADMTPQEFVRAAVEASLGRLRDVDNKVLWTKQDRFLIPPHCADVPLEMALPDEIEVPR